MHINKVILFAGFMSMVLAVLGQEPIDKGATKKTRFLLHTLHSMAENGVMFGHQDDQAYGVGWRAEDGRSDVLETTGQYPAVHGWDLGKDLNSEMNIDSVNYDNMKRWIKEAYKRGGINTFSFHMDNLTSGGSSWDKMPSVVDILPGGDKHQAFNEQLDLLADFIMDCKNIPMVFRPWHEHNGDWFWWGKGNCTEEEYIQLFRYTVDYLKDTKGIHQLLYAFSPDRSRLPLDENQKQTYLYGYPGDDYVDIIGIDNYGDVGRNKNMPVETQKQNLIASLKLITEVAEEKNKVAALTETGLESVTKTDWYTDLVLNPLKENKDEVKIAWILVWRNSNLKNHYYAPYPGHPAAEDFRKFEKDDFTIFEADLSKRTYKKPKN
jgi:mannan endo-1,4-beta-mannosidase